MAWGLWGSQCLPVSRNPWPVGGEGAQSWPRQGPFPSGLLNPDRKRSPSQGRPPGAAARELPWGPEGLSLPPGAALGLWAPRE